MVAGAFPNPCLRAFHALALAWWLAAVPAMLCAQGPAPVAPAQFDPSDVYFQGYLACRSAEQLEAGGDFLGAQEKLEKAINVYVF